MNNVVNCTKRWQWYTIGIAIFIFWEIFWLEFAGIRLDPLLYIVFYILDIIFFLVSGNILLPWLANCNWHTIVKIIMVVLIIIGASFFLLFVSSVCEAILEEQSFGFYFKKAYLSKNAFRCFYLFTLALADWHFRYRTQKNKEMQAKELQLLRTQQREAQLENAYLRAQINPHLLFNTLNSIYKDAYEKAPAAAETVFLLAGIMDYSLQNERHDGLVPLSDDLEQLDRLIKLETELNKRLYVTVTIKIDPSLKDALVPPLLFIDYVQNIFKHGDLSDSTRPARIRIIAEKGTLTLETSNKISGATTASRHTGIANAARRLEKVFPDNFQLKTQQQADEFLLHLNIRLQL